MSGLSLDVRYPGEVPDTLYRVAIAYRKSVKESGNPRDQMLWWYIADRLETVARVITREMDKYEY